MGSRPPAPWHGLSAAQPFPPHPLHWAFHPGEQLGLTGRKRPAFCSCPLLQVRPVGIGDGSCQACTLKHLVMGQGSGCSCHGLAAPYHIQQATQWGPLTHSHPVTESVPAQRLWSLRDCPSAIGTMVLWGGETDFPSWGIMFSLSMGSANYVLCQQSRPQWPQSLCFLWCYTRLGIMQSRVWAWGQRASSSHTPEVQIGTWQPHRSTSGTPHQLLATSPILPAQVAALIMSVLSPFSPLSPWGRAFVLLYRSNSLHLRCTADKSCQWWQVGGVGWRQTWEVLERHKCTVGRNWTRKEATEREIRGRTFWVSQSWLFSQNVELAGLQQGLGQIWMVVPFRGSNHRSRDS